MIKLILCQNLFPKSYRNGNGAIITTVQYTIRKWLTKHQRRENIICILVNYDVIQERNKNERGESMSGCYISFNR